MAIGGKSDRHERRLKQAKSVARAATGRRLGAHSKQEVDGKLLRDWAPETASVVELGSASGRTDYTRTAQALPGSTGS